MLVELLGSWCDTFVFKSVGERFKPCLQAESAETATSFSLTAWSGAGGACKTMYEKLFACTPGLALDTVFVSTEY